MFRFTIRDVLWLTVVVAVGLAVGLPGVAYYAGAVSEQRRLQVIIADQESVIAELVNSVQFLQSRQSAALLASMQQADQQANAAAPAITLGITEVDQMIKMIESKVPIGTPLDKARKFMEREGFKCTIKKNGEWGELKRVDYLYCTRSELSGIGFVDRRWLIALIYRDEKIAQIEANSGLVGP